MLCKCGHIAKSKLKYLNHVETDHDIKLHMVDEKFKTFKEFQSWLFNAQTTHSVYFVKPRGSRTLLNGHQKLSYLCNRSGSRLSEATGKRAPKSNCVKTGIECTCFLKVVRYTEGDVSVFGCLTHFGHDIDLFMLRSLRLKEVTTQSSEENTSNEFIEQKNDNDKDSDVNDVKKELLVQQLTDIINKLETIRLTPSECHAMKSLISQLSNVVYRTEKSIDNNSDNVRTSESPNTVESEQRISPCLGKRKRTVQLDSIALSDESNCDATN